MSEDINKSLYWGIGIIAALVVLISVFVLAGPIATESSRDYVRDNFSSLTFIRDGEVVEVESYDHLSAYRLEVDRETGIVFIKDKPSTLLPPFFFIPIH